MIKQSKWIYPERQPISEELLKTAGSEVIANLLINRGIDTHKKAEIFLNPHKIQLSSPFVFNDMGKTVARIKKAVENNEHIVVYGDFDADGVTSTSLLFKTFQHIGANFSYYIPDRIEEGHGLNSGAICKLISAKKAKVIITVDCGISNIVEITLAKSLGTDVIVTDHHEAPEILPPAYAIINPKSPDALSENLPSDEIKSLTCLAGVGVAYKLACAVLAEFDKSEFHEEIMYLAAIGTIADVVPLLGENRYIVKRGLELIGEKKPFGVMKILETAGCNIDKGISSDMVGFAIAPRINAVGRLDSASIAVDLLTGEDEEKIATCAKELNHNNKIRQQLCETTFMEADTMVQKDPNFALNKSIILYSKNWNPGIVGIVASKLVEKYYKPAFMIVINEENKEARCSARSIEELNLYETMCMHEDIFSHFGGHALAAGFAFSLEKMNIEEFKKILSDTINEKLENTELQPKIKIDADLLPEELNSDFIEKINKLAPFGEGNSFPVFSFLNMVLRQYKTIGSANNHLKITLSDKDSNTFEGIWWSKNSLDAEVMDSVNIAFAPKENTFNGKTTVQLEVKDLITVGGKKQSVNVSENTDKIKWLDHRQKIGIIKPVLGYIKTANSKISIFIENKDILKLIENEETAAKKVISRLTLEKTDQIMFFDFPADKDLFAEILEKTKPQMVHLMPFYDIKHDNDELIKTISGMMKYAYSNKNGKINISELASKLSISNKAVKICAELLGKSGIINILDLSEQDINFKFLQGKGFLEIFSQKEYAQFIEEMANIEKFRHKLLYDEISNIKNEILAVKI